MRRIFLLFLALVAAPAAAEPADDGWSEPIPFELDRNLIFVAVAVDGLALRSFILDTGAYTMLDARAAESLAMPRRLVGTTDGIGANQQPVYRPETPYRLDLAGHEVAPARTLIVPLLAVEQCLSRDFPGVPAGRPHRAVDGILGRELFDRFVVEIDYPRRQLRLRTPEGWRPPDGSRPIPVELTPQHFYVGSVVRSADGRTLPARLLVDTGFALGLGLNRAFVEANSLRPAPGSFEPTPTCGLAGEVAEPSEIAYVAGVSVAHAAAGRTETEFSRSQQATAFDGFLGGGFLKAFRVTVALQRRELLLEPALPGG